MLISRRTVGTVILILCMGILVTTKFHIGEGIRSLVVQGFKPVLKISSSVIAYVSNIRDELRLNASLRDENNRLHTQLEELEQKVIQLTEYALENKRLKLLLDLKEEIEYDTIPAQVIGRDLSGWSQTIIIDKGSKHGLTENMPVVSGQGVVGKVTEVGMWSSKVELLIDAQARIGGILQKSRLVGLVEGMGKGYLVINYLPRDEKIFVDDLVLSSGLGLVFEKGLVIGTVESIHEESFSLSKYATTHSKASLDEIADRKFSLYKYAIVRPSVEFGRLEEVLVILKAKEEF